MVAKLKREQLYQIWIKQKKRCPRCDQPITLETEWKMDRIRDKSEGGKNNLMNLMMIHPTCYKHVQKMNGEKV
jgi:RNA-directed DNA polymerase